MDTSKAIKNLTQKEKDEIVRRQLAQFTAEQRLRYLKIKTSKINKDKK
jgi:hypothetical protein